MIVILKNKTIKSNVFEKNGLIKPFYRFDKFKIIVIITLGTISTAVGNDEQSTRSKGNNGRVN